ncbi:hypothetical protein BD779DRAFT_827835 [Infundibulicybe gibba]|nr:hypothetical protein BD779DRAFT_827835 [Infundibulicybe gibba]
MPCQNCSCPSCLALAGSQILPTELPLPPPELMTTNRPPTGFEVGRSRIVINSTEKRMSLLEAAMDDLAGEMDKIRRVVRMHRAAISPLRAFPPEILVAIFAEYIDMKNPWFALPPPVSPLSLMWICSRWRAIVMETPQFWTKISDSTPVLDSWINRSKELPLDLHFDLSSDDANPTLGALIPQAHRWEQVHFTLRSDSNSALSSVRGHLRSLKRLRISCLNITGVLDFCEEAPQLTDIQLEKVPNPLVMKLPWEQLQDCTLDGSMITLYTLQQAKNIQTFHLQMDGSRPPKTGYQRNWYLGRFAIRNSRL